MSAKASTNVYCAFITHIQTELQAKAKTALKIDLDFPPNRPDKRFADYANTVWVRVDDVLAIVKKVLEVQKP